MERQTESRNPRARNLSTISTRQILELINDEDATIAGAVRAAIPEIERAVDLVVAAIVVEVGPEVIAGSSRMKAGTATKLVLNMLSTTSMVKLGRTRDDLMVDLRPTNEKLRQRAIRLVEQEAHVSAKEATRRLEAWGWHVRAAIEDRWPAS